MSNLVEMQLVKVPGGGRKPIRLTIFLEASTKPTANFHTDVVEAKLNATSRDTASLVIGAF